MGFLQLAHVALSGALLWALGKIIASGLPWAWRLAVALPLVGLGLALGFALRHRSGDDETGGPWRFTPLGRKLNFAHPATRNLLKAWAVLGACWAVALDEAVRHDISRAMGW